MTEDSILEEENYMNLAKIGYEAYCKSTGGKSAITGDKLPAFENTPKTVQMAWAAAAYSIAEECG